MPYRVFSGPPGTKDVSAVDRAHLLFKELGTLDEALSWARHLEKSGRTPLLIEGDDGTYLDKRAIAGEVRLSERDGIHN